MTARSYRESPPVCRSTPSGAFDQYLLDIRKLPMISDPDEEKRLARRALAGDEAAAERLVTANLRFVISYVKRYQGHGLDLSELVAIGNEGLLKAVKKFDPDHGVKFISYAVWWVRQAVLKALAEQTRSVRIPLNQNSALVRMSRAKSFLAQELGREPTDAEIAMALNDTVENIRSAHRMTSTEVSLDAPVERQDRGASTFGERVAGTGGIEIEEMTDVRLQREFIDRIFQRHLTPRERQDPVPLLRARGGLRGAHAGKDRRAARGHPRAHPADPGARLREAARFARCEVAPGVLGSSLKDGTRGAVAMGGLRDRRPSLEFRGVGCSGAAHPLIANSYLPECPPGFPSFHFQWCCSPGRRCRCTSSSRVTSDAG